MTTDIIYAANVPDGYLQSNNADYATCRAGSSLQVVLPNVFGPIVGGTSGTIEEAFEQFDTSVVGTDEISSAVLSLYVTGYSYTGTWRARLYDWGTGLATGDWVPGANLSALPLLAHLTNPTVTAYRDFTDDALAANINKTGITKLVLVTANLEAATPDSAYGAYHGATGTAYDPKLTITHAAPAAPAALVGTSAGVSAAAAALTTVIRMIGSSAAVSVAGPAAMSGGSSPMGDRILLESGTYGYLLEDGSGVLHLEPFGVTVGGVDQTVYLLAGSLTLRFNSFDFTLKSPSTVPALGDAVNVGAMGWHGTVVSVASSEPPLRLAARLVHITASNADVAYATAAPFALSDAPSAPTSYSYRDLTYTLSRGTDGDHTQGTLTCYQPGLWPAMTFALTSANYGLAAANFTVSNVTVTWLDLTHLEYHVEFGDPMVTLSAWVGLSPDGTIDGTRITDGSIETPALSATLVVANVANIGGTVVIDSSGIAITGGAITVTNGGGTVIIDGTSDMFRILASGGLSVAFPAAPGSASSTVSLTGLGEGYTVAPACLLMTSFNNTYLNPRTMGYYNGTTAAGAVTYQSYLRESLSSSPGHPVISLVAISNTTDPGATSYGYYAAFDQVAI